MYRDPVCIRNTVLLRFIPPLIVKAFRSLAQVFRDSDWELMYIILVFSVIGVFSACRWEAPRGYELRARHMFIRTSGLDPNALRLILYSARARQHRLGTGIRHSGPSAPTDHNKRLMSRMARLPATGIWT